jgi:hypothetical protein
MSSPFIGHIENVPNRAARGTLPVLSGDRLSLPIPGKGGKWQFRSKINKKVLTKVPAQRKYKVKTLHGRSNYN